MFCNCLSRVRIKEVCIFSVISTVALLLMLISCGKNITYTGESVYEGMYYNQFSRDTITSWYDRWLSKCTVPVKNEYVNTSYGKIHMLTWGDTNNPALLLIHGGQANATHWIDMVPYLVNNFYIIAPDVIGDPSGKTMPDTVPVTRFMYQKWLDELLAALSINKIFLAGHSFGGLIAMDYAQYKPDRIKKLAVLDPAGIHGMSFKAKFGLIKAGLFSGDNNYKEMLDILR